MKMVDRIIIVGYYGNKNIKVGKSGEWVIKSESAKVKS